MYKHVISILFILLTYIQPTLADDSAKPEPEINLHKPFWNIQTSVYTKHFNPKSYHNNHQELIALDYTNKYHWFFGGTTFRNSFYQRSVYLYTGKRFELPDTPFYARVSGGFIWGYRGKYKHKIPLNDLGVAPAIIPSLGGQWRYFNAEILMLGFNATMINVGIKIY